jgi:hypothetical protein
VKLANIPPDCAKMGKLVLPDMLTVFANQIAANYSSSLTLQPNASQ